MNELLNHSDIDFSKDFAEFCVSKHDCAGHEFPCKRCRRHILSLKLREFYSFRDRAKRRQFIVGFGPAHYWRLKTSECAYCGDSDRMTIDRLNNNKGYTAKNSVAACRLCNLAKSNQEITVWFARMKRILERARIDG